MSIGFGGSSSKSKQNSYSESNPLTAKEMQYYWNRLNKNTGGDLNSFAKQGTATTDYAGVADPGQYFSTDVSYKPVTADVGYKPVSADLSYSPLGRDVTYRAVSDAQIKNLGGAGATRELKLKQAWDDALSQTNSDAGLTLAQRQRSNQLSNRDFSQQQDAIGKEVEAAITQAALQQAQADQGGRQAQAGFDADQWARELEARKAAADFAAGQAQADQAGRLAQGNFDAGQAQAEQAGRVASAEQAQNLASFLQTETGKQYEAAARNAGLKRDDLLALAQIFFQGKGQKTRSSGNQRSDSFDFNANVSGLGGE